MNAAANSQPQHLGATLAVAAAGPFLVLIAFTLPLTTLMSTADALGAGPGLQAWIMSGMSVGAASGLLSSGAIGDDYGRRRVFVGGAWLLALASVLGALAPTGLVVVIARVLGGWRLAYLFTAVATAALAVAGRALLPEARAAVPRRIDVAGTLLLGLGIATLLSALVEGRLGWERLAVVALLVIGATLLAAFVAVERRIEGPMLDLGLFRQPDFLGATVAALAAGAGVLALVSSLPMLLERAAGTSTMLSALMLLAWSATSVVTAFAVRWLPAGVTPRAQLVAGLVGAAAGQLALTGLGTDPSLARLIPALLAARRWPAFRRGEPPWAAAPTTPPATSAPVRGWRSSPSW